MKSEYNLSAGNPPHGRWRAHVSASYALAYVMLTLAVAGCTSGADPRSSGCAMPGEFLLPSRMLIDGEFAEGPLAGMGAFEWSLEFVGPREVADTWGNPHSTVEARWIWDSPADAKHTKTWWSVDERRYLAFATNRSGPPEQSIVPDTPSLTYAYDPIHEFMLPYNREVHLPAALALSMVFSREQGPVYTGNTEWIRTRESAEVVLLTMVPGSNPAASEAAFEFVMAPAGPCGVELPRELTVRAWEADYDLQVRHMAISWQWAEPMQTIELAERIAPGPPPLSADRSPMLYAAAEGGPGFVGPPIDNPPVMPWFPLSEALAAASSHPVVVEYSRSNDGSAVAVASYSREDGPAGTSYQWDIFITASPCLGSEDRDGVVVQVVRLAMASNSGPQLSVAYGSQNCLGLGGTTETMPLQWTALASAWTHARAHNSTFPAFKESVEVFYAGLADCRPYSPWSAQFLLRWADGTGGSVVASVSAITGQLLQVRSLEAPPFAGGMGVFGSCPPYYIE